MAKSIKTVPSDGMTTDDDQDAWDFGYYGSCTHQCESDCIGHCEGGGCMSQGCTTDNQVSCTEFKDNSCISTPPPHDSVLTEGLGPRSESIGISRITI